MTGVERLLMPLAVANLIANIGIVVTGGAVRLTASGLGCPTWPRCTDESFTPRGELEFHSAIEFGNRMLTFALAAIAIACWVVALLVALRARRSGDGRWRPFVLATVIALGVPAQAVIGGVTVLTDLNPWVVAFHLLVSMAIIGVCVTLLDCLRDEPRTAAPGAHQAVAWLAFAAGWAVLYLGTVVTGSGPHAGDADARRNGLDPLQVTQLHADAVFLLLGLAVALVVVHRTGATVTLLVVLLAQGAVGFVQYFTDLPVVLVGAHMLGAALISAAMTWAVLDTRERAR